MFTNLKNIVAEKEHGFTLLELIVVIIIIGILATVGLTQYTKQVERSRFAEGKANVGIMRQLAYEYYLKNGTLSTITSADVGIVTGSTILPPGCVSTHYFYYAVAWSTDTTVSLVAVRCTSGGKSPQWGGSSFCLGGIFNATTGGISGHCGCGSGCAEVGLPGDF
ncbi:MAG: prepilin-type N-terminal cleavage/methylation domain-containing protein [Candidatus Omnitrophica bacterium]|nr:prepilin-type N-terminal cleavage/methylation domain-containing protein [Candidatus Omnitrophota bacterium]